MPGRSFKDANGVLERRSVLAVPKKQATDKLSCVNIGDVIYSLDTTGYIEKINEVSSLKSLYLFQDYLFRLLVSV